MKYSIQSARCSNICLLPPKFVVVDIYKLGTHKQANNQNSDQMLNVFKSVVLEGYKGPAITVIEYGKDDIFEHTKENTFETVQIEYGDFGVADGHNRLECFKFLNDLGIVKETYLPVQIIPGRKPEIVSIEVDNSDEVPWTIEQIENCFKDEGKVLELDNSSHFEAHFKDGISRRVREGQPDILIPRSDFIHIDRFEGVKKAIQLGEFSENFTKILSTYSVEPELLLNYLP